MMNYEKVNEDFYSKNYWGLDRSKNKWFSKYVKAKILGKFIKSIKGRKVLYDAGGGVGNWGSYFGSGFRQIIVSDISKKALKYIPEKNIIKLNCSVLKNKLPDEYADCILLIDVFEHIEKKDIPAMLNDLRRILKPNGRILIFTSLYGWGFGIIQQRIFHPEKRLIGNEHLEGHLNRLKFDEFKDLFKKAGLTIDDFYFYSIFFQQITDSIKDNFAKIASKFLGRIKIDKDIGREGQSIKENLRKREGSSLLKVPLIFLSLISYLDIILFGKIIKGNSVFFSLKK